MVRFFLIKEFLEIKYFTKINTKKGKFFPILKDLIPRFFTTMWSKFGLYFNLWMFKNHSIWMGTSSIILLYKKCDWTILPLELRANCILIKQKTYFISLYTWHKLCCVTPVKLTWLIIHSLSKMLFLPDLTFGAWLLSVTYIGLLISILI